MTFIRVGVVWWIKQQPRRMWGAILVRRALLTLVTRWAIEITLWCLVLSHVFQQPQEGVVPVLFVLVWYTTHATIAFGRHRAMASCLPLVSGADQPRLMSTKQLRRAVEQARRASAEAAAKTAIDTQRAYLAAAVTKFEKDSQPASLASLWKTSSFAQQGVIVMVCVALLAAFGLGMAGVGHVPANQIVPAVHQVTAIRRFCHARVRLECELCRTQANECSRRLFTKFAYRGSVDDFY
jgi:hypothetical protein